MGIATPASNNACIDLWPQRASTIYRRPEAVSAKRGAIGIFMIILNLTVVWQHGIRF